MKKSILIYFLIAIGYLAPCFGQKKDSLKNSLKLKSFVLPSSIIALGISQIGYQSNELQAKVTEKFPFFKSNLDDYAQYLPVNAFLFSGILAGQSQNTLKSRMVLTAISYGTMALTVSILKKVINKQRPDLSDHYSFPSGHTANAFTGAELFHQELKYSYPVLSYAAYPIAAGVGVFRMLNNKHYLSDVLVGAGIGILSAKFAYGIYHPKGKEKPQKFNLNFSPTKVMGQNGFSISGSF